MKAIIDLARMELQKLFYSPIAWLVLIIFGVQSGIQYIDIISGFVKSSEMGYGNEAITTQAYAGMFGFFSSIQNTLYLYIPLITMGLMSKEFGSGSIKLLYSSPISNIQIVLGKYVAVLVFSAAMVMILFIESIFGFVSIKDFDFPQVLTGLLGMFLVIATYSAIGLFMSSLTSYQIVAAIGSFAAFFMLGQVGSMWQTVDFVKDITYWLSIGGRSQTFIQGLICSEDFLYFILVSFLFIAFTVFKLRGIREKSPRYVSFTRYAGVFLLVALIGYFSTIPSLMKYHDSTRTKLNTLTENSQEVISKLEGKIKITTYVNLFGRNFYYGLPYSQKRDESGFDQYRRFYPGIKMEYKYYYDIPVQENFAKSHYQRYPGMTEKEVLKKICDLYNMDTADVKPGKNFINEIDLKSELNRFVRKIETSDGRTVHLRIFDDMMKLPDESQITAAFKQLIGDLPLVGFVKGDKQRDINNFGTRGYYTFTQEKPFRWSLLNNGVQITSLMLDKPVDPKINILVIADIKTQFNETEMKNLEDFIDRGGNLVIACDRKRQEIMNPLVEQFGVKFLPGQIVEHNKGYAMDLVTAEVTGEGKNLAYQFDEYILQREGCVTMPGAVALSYEEKPGFKYIPVLVSDTVKNMAQIDSIGSWNELNTTDFVDDIAKYTLEKGETLGSLTTALALTREVGGKQQRIMILGDADYLSNGELSARRKGINASNFTFINGLFFWLTYEESPIDVRRPHNPDDNMLLKKDDMGFYKILYKIIIPALLALAFLLIWLRRKGR